MTPKEEVRAALLNNSSISTEAAAYLDNILNNESSSNSSGGILWISVTIQYDSDTDSYICTADKTFEEIASAIDNGIIPMVVTGSGAHAYYQLSSYAENGVQFSRYLATPGGDGITISMVEFDNEEEIDYYIYTIYGNQSHGVS